VVGPPLVVFAATHGRRGGIAVHVTLMNVSVIIEVGRVVGFSFLMAPSPRRAALPHRLTGPSGVLVWCLALLTGISNYVFST
jgi:hypothetical protein